MVVYSALGKSVHLRCSAIVPFDTKFFWHRTDNQSLSNHTKKFRSHHGYDGASAQTSLHVKDIERADFGNYTCFAESMAGQSQASIELRGNETVFERDSPFSSRVQRFVEQQRRLRKRLTPSTRARPRHASRYSNETKVNESTWSPEIMTLLSPLVSEQMTVSSSSSSALCSSLVYLFSVFIQQMSHNRT